MRTIFSSLRFRLVLLVLLAVIPATVVIYNSARARRDDGGEQVQSQALQLAQIASIEYDHALQSTREFLLPLAHVFALVPNIETLDNRTCGLVLDPLMQNDPRYSFVGVAAPDGRLLCGSPASSTGTSGLASEPFFKAARDSRGFSVSALSSDPASGKPTIQAGYPILTPGGPARGVVFATLDLGGLSRTLSVPSLPAGAFVMLFSKSGLVLAYYPDPDRWVGHTLEVAPGVGDSPSKTRRTSEGTSLEGEPVLMATLGLTSGGSGGGTTTASPEVFVSVGIPKSEAYGAVNDQLRWDLLALAAVAVVGIAAAWFGSGLFLRQLHRYAQTANRLAGGDLEARVGPNYPRNEVGQLGRAFDEMAAVVGARETEIRALNEGLEVRVADRTAELEAANRELESFSYSVSHDLRAPLRAIDGFSRMLLEDAGESLDADAHRYLEVVRSNTLKMGALIDDLLAFARLGRQPVVRQEVDQVAMVQSVVSEFVDPSPNPPAVTIEHLPCVSADPKLLRQVWVNLVSNAAKFSSKGDAPRVQVGSCDQGGETVFFVRDNGAGFDMQYADKLFGVFQRLHRAEEFDGTGVGLAIVQRIVARHGGRVWADAKLGEGATFFFTIGKDGHNSTDGKEPHDGI